MNEPIIEVRELKKVYPSAGTQPIEAVKGISFDVGAQEIFGLLGPNGAGKSTTIGMLTTMVTITEGAAIIAGVDVARDPISVKQKIAVVPQSTNLDRGLTARENLIYHAKYFGISTEDRETRAQDLLELMALSERAGDYPQSFSGGMARRLQIARAMMHNPRVLFLDEATTGLDPQSRLMIWHKVRGLNETGQTIFLTTHYMEEADQLCDRVAIIDHGQILAIDTPANLKATIPGGNVIEIKTSDYCPELSGWLKNAIPDLTRVECEDHSMKLFLTKPEEGLVDIVEAIRARGIVMESIQLHSVTLEDVFVHMTGRALRE